MNEEQIKKLLINGERAAFLIGTMTGSISAILNGIKNKTMTIDDVYYQLIDINKSAAMQVHELYYKEDEPKHSLATTEMGE
jgi:hypothetical protein